MDIFGGLRKLLGIQQSQPQRPQAVREEIPDITVDPTGRLPYSARTPELARQGNAYTANPTAPEFIGVDPAQFGYPADNTVRPMQPIQPNYGGVSGAVNPVWQQQQGMGISNPLGISRRNGGPTPEPLPAFAEILKRLR